MCNLTALVLMIISFCRNFDNHAMNIALLVFVALAFVEDGFSLFKITID